MKIITRVFFKLCSAGLLFSVMFLGNSSSHFDTSPAYSVSQFSPEFQKGVCYAAWQRNKYSSPFSDASLERLADIGTEWVSIVVTWYQDEADSLSITPDANTPSDRSLKHAIAKAHRLGLKVMLKPHIDLRRTNTGDWRGDIYQNSENSWREWFGNYRKFIARYASLAESSGVEIFCVGTELLLTTDRKQDWQEVIRTVRTLYDGPLTYAAHWDGEFMSIAFWEELDYIGIDAYFPLSEKAAPTMREIKEGWREWLNVLEPWAESMKKPVIFTEVGYSSSAGSARSPWEERMPGNVNLTIQKECYEALFEMLWEKKWFSGLYWWRWNTNAKAGGSYNKGFTPQNKPAEKVLAEWYQKGAPRFVRPKGGLSVTLDDSTIHIGTI